MYNIKLPLSDADRATWQAAILSVATAMAPYVPTVEGADRRLHIKPEDLETVELVLEYAKRHPDQLIGTIDLPSFEQLIELAKFASTYEERVQEQLNQVRRIAMFARDFAYDTARMINRVEQAKGRNATNAAILDSFGKRFAKQGVKKPAATTLPTTPPAGQ